MNGHTFYYYVFSFLFFFLLLWISKQKKGLRLFDEKGFAANMPMLIGLHIAGIFLFGILPFLFAHPGSFVFFKMNSAGNSSAMIVALLAFMSLMITPRILEKKFGKSQSFVSETSLGTAFLLAYFPIRIVFIVVYECWFRGFLLTDSIISFGIIWAILINICLHALLHVVNGKDEVIGCFPYGLLLCLLCIWQGAVWPAFVLHLALTLPYELGYIRKMKFKIALQV